MVNYESIFNDLVSELKIPIVEERNYWLIRTEGGKYYFDFVFNGYVAIGWDFLSITDIRESGYSHIKDIVLEHSPKDKAPGRVASKLKKFVEHIKKGDVAIIPSVNSETASIGIFTENNAYENPNYVEEYYKNNPGSDIVPCPYIKRRKVEWVSHIEKDRLGVYLTKLFSSHEAVYSANEYSQYIERSIHDVYIKEDRVHSTFRAGHPNGFSLKDLNEFVDFLNTSIDHISEITGMDIDKNEIDMKLNIHSPGLIQVISMGAFAGLGLAILIGALNNFINGGKLKFTYKDETFKKEISFETESPGLAGRKLENKKLDLEHERFTYTEKKLTEKLVRLQEDVQLSIPSPEESTEVLLPPKNKVDNP